MEPDIKIASDVFIPYMKNPFVKNVIYLVKWVLLSLLIGGVGGLAGGAFAWLIQFATGLRADRSWIVALLPVIGLLIILIYKVTGEEHNRGTNMIIASISEKTNVTVWTGPLIFVSTILSHAGGASVGREGAALQLGGWMGARASDIFRMDETNRRVAIMCGMAAVFSALFGTPVAAAVFCIEVISVGTFYFEALMPCIFSAFFSQWITTTVYGLEGEHWQIASVPELDLKMLGITVLLGLCCAGVAILIVTVLHQSQKYISKFLPNPFVRAAVCGALFAAIILIFHAQKYTGTGMALIDAAMEGQVDYPAFIIKLLLTALVLAGGFRGGEIVPTLSIGATFGAAFGSLLGLPVPLSAACGMIAVFAGATNCPVAALLIAMEMFHGTGLPFFAITVALSFVISGHFSLYDTQRFNYSFFRD